MTNIYIIVVVIFVIAIVCYSDLLWPENVWKDNIDDPADQWPFPNFRDVCSSRLNPTNFK